MTPPSTIKRSLRVLSILLLGILCTALLQNTPVYAGDDEWQPVDPAQLALKQGIIDPDADAEAIFWEIQIDDGGANDLVLSHYVRIKIFSERGREKRGEIDIPFTKGIKIKDLAARTIKPDGSIVVVAKADIIEKTVVKVDDISLKSKKFAFPGAEVGSIIEYKWKEVISNSSANNLRLQFQRDIPVHLIKYRIKPTKDRTLDLIPFNMEKPPVQKEKNGFFSLQVEKATAFHSEPMMPPQENVRAWAMLKYRSFLGSSYPLLAFQTYLFTQSLWKVDDKLKHKAEEIVAGATTPEDKVQKIFDFCRTNIKNVDSQNSGLTAEELEKRKENKTPSDVLKRGMGSATDVDILFGALCNAAGIRARFALLPDRSKRFFDPNVVIPGALKPAAIAVKVGERWKFLSPGAQTVAPGMLRWQFEGVDALVADDSVYWLKTPLSPPSKSKVKRTAKLTLDEAGTLEGDVTVEYTGHLALEQKDANEDDSPAQQEENLKTALKERLSAGEVSNIVIESSIDSDKPFITKYHIRIPQYAQRTGKRLFLQPGFFHKGIAAMFSESKREYAIYFRFPWSEDDSIEFTLPKGYVLDNPDRPGIINVGNISRHEVNMGITSDNSKLIYRRVFFFAGNDAIVFPAEGYAQVKNVFDEVHKADNHTITLKQTGP